MWCERRNQKFQQQTEIQTMYKTMLSYLKCRKNTGRKIQEFDGLKTEE